jgi:hypothetical protein
MKISPTAALVRPSIHNTGATGLAASLRCDDAGEVIVLFDPTVLRHASIQAREALRARGWRQGLSEEAKPERGPTT